MSRTDEATESPNDKLPDGKPLDPNRVVSADHAGSASIEEEVRNERDESVLKDEFEGLENDLVNVRKFVDQTADNAVPAPVDEGADKSSLSDKAPGRQSTEEAGSRS